MIYLEEIIIQIMIKIIFKKGSNLFVCPVQLEFYSLHLFQKSIHQLIYCNLFGMHMLLTGKKAPV